MIRSVCNYVHQELIIIVEHVLNVLRDVLLVMLLNVQLVQITYYWQMVNVLKHALMVVSRMIVNVHNVLTNVQHVHLIVNVLHV